MRHKELLHKKIPLLCIIFTLNKKNQTEHLFFTVWERNSFSADLSSILWWYHYDSMLWTDIPGFFALIFTWNLVQRIYVYHVYHLAYSKLLQPKKNCWTKFILACVNPTREKPSGSKMVNTTGDAWGDYKIDNRNKIFSSGLTLQGKLSS